MFHTKIEVNSSQFLVTSKAYPKELYRIYMQRIFSPFSPEVVAYWGGVLVTCLDNQLVIHRWRFPHSGSGWHLGIWCARIPSAPLACSGSPTWCCEHLPSHSIDRWWLLFVRCEYIRTNLSDITAHREPDKPSLASLDQLGKHRPSGSPCCDIALILTHNNHRLSNKFFFPVDFRKER